MDIAEVDVERDSGIGLPTPESGTTLRDALIELNMVEVALGVAVTRKGPMSPMSPMARLPMRLEASVGLMVRVVGGNITVDPGCRIIVTVTVPPLFVEVVVELPLSEEVHGSVPFEVMLDVSPPSAPVA